MDRRRCLTALRLVAHWATGAVIGLTIEHNAWTRGATLALALHILTQLIGLKLEGRKRAKNV